jgi:hypothetical protein
VSMPLGDEVRTIREDNLPWLFVSERQAQLTRQAVKSGSPGEKAKLGRVWPHMLRHSCATTSPTGAWNYAPCRTTLAAIRSIPPITPELPAGKRLARSQTSLSAFQSLGLSSSTWRDNHSSALRKKAASVLSLGKTSTPARNRSCISSNCPVEWMVLRRFGLAHSQSELLQTLRL